MLRFSRTSAARADSSPSSTCTHRLLSECGGRRFRSTLEWCASAPETSARHFPPLHCSKTDKERAMGHPAHHNKINYVEFSTTDVGKTKAFYGKVFGWEFQDWGEDYVSFSSETGGIDGGFRIGPVPEKTGES